MSETYTPAAEPEDSPDSGDESDAPELEGQEGEEDGEGEGEEPERKPVDWQKQAHDKAGQAAKERSRRRAAERDLGELRSRFEALESRVTSSSDDELTALIRTLRDDDDEPITDINQLKKAMKVLLANQEASTADAENRNKTTRAVQGVMRSMSEFETDFAADHPDYFEAAKFYRETREQELSELGYDGPALQAQLARDLFGAVQSASQSGRDPAEVVYGLAKRRGFATGKDAATAKLQKLQKANGSTGTPGGKSGSGNLSWNSVAKLKGADRDKEFAKLRARELGKS